MSDAAVDRAEIVNDEDAERFEVVVAGHTAVVEYRREGGEIVFTHTEVPEQIEGIGVGGRLARVALEFARAEGLTVVPSCPYIAAFIRRHPEYLPLVRPDIRARLARRS